MHTPAETEVAGGGMGGWVGVIMAHCDDDDDDDDHNRLHTL